MSSQLSLAGSLPNHLPGGSFGKRVPVQCTLCKSKTWPEGKVVECNQLKVYNLQYFLGSHSTSSGHQKALVRDSQPVVAAHKSKCEALCIESPMADKLYMFRDEFRLWAEHTNFENMAKHSYWQAPNSTTWFVRSADCEQECDHRPGNDYQVCRECLDLGHGQRVPGWILVYDVCMCLLLSA